MAQDDQYNSNVNGQPRVIHRPLPAKMVMEPLPQMNGQSISDYIRYYDKVISSNLWDDQTAAFYLPQLITEQRYIDLILSANITTEQRNSYQWLRRKILDESKYKPRNEDRSLYANYSSRICSLKNHVVQDVFQFRQGIEGLVGDTYQHITKHYFNPEPIMKTVLPTNFEKRVTTILNGFVATANQQRQGQATGSSTSNYEISTGIPPPSYQEAMHIDSTEDV